MIARFLPALASHFSLFGSLFVTVVWSRSKQDIPLRTLKLYDVCDEDTTMDDAVQLKQRLLPFVDSKFLPGYPINNLVAEYASLLNRSPRIL